MLKPLITNPSQFSQKRFLLDQQLERALSKQSLDNQERAFAVALAEGVLRMWYGLQTVIADISHHPLDSLPKPDVLVMMMGVYQLLWMDSVPDYAACDMTIDLAKSLKRSKKACGFMNALMRSVQRECDRFKMLCLTNQQPRWWQHYIDEHTHINQSDLAYLYTQRPVCLRINPLRCSLEQLQQILQDKGYSSQLLPNYPDMLMLENSSLIADLPGFKEGWFVVQNPAASMPVRVLAPKPGEVVFDIGAAPGTKTTQLAILMQNKGRVLAIDPSESRLTKVKENVHRLGLSGIEWVCCEGEQLSPEQHGLADHILVDVPCSGTGVVSKHAEIMVTFRPNQLKRFSVQQQSLLEASWRCLKPGGTLVYSTCSVCPEENQDVIECWRRSQGDVELIAQHQQWPTELLDGFYWAHCRKRM